MDQTTSNNTKKFYKKRFRIDDIICAAAQNGHVNILRWMKNNGYKIESNSALLYAVSGNKLESLKCLFELGFYKDKNIDLISEAIIKGNFEIIEWVKNNDFLLVSEAYKTAAAHGRLDIFKWLYNNGCPLNSNMMYYIISFEYDNKLEIMRYLKEINCPGSNTDLFNNI